VSSPLSLDTVNQMDRDAFTRNLGGVFELAPWVAVRAWATRPFASVAALHAAMCEVVRRATADEQRALLGGHPDLAGKAARAGAMTASSVAEQASAGLDQLTDAEFERFERLNLAYRQRFGFPFIIAVRRHDKAGILAAFERRLGHTIAEEIAEALAQRLAPEYRRLVAENDDGRIARHDADGDEDQRQHRPQGGNGEEEALDHKANHAHAAPPRPFRYFFVVASVITGPRWIAASNL